MDDDDDDDDNDDDADAGGGGEEGGRRMNMQLRIHTSNIKVMDSTNSVCRRNDSNKSKGESAGLAGVSSGVGLDDGLLVCTLLLLI